jgi:hypothetical protein
MLTLAVPDDHPKSDANGDAPLVLHADEAGKPVANGVHRKLTIPAELPPPFYPSNKTDTSTPPVNRSGAMPPLIHRSQLSAGAVAFNVANGSTSHPATPHELDRGEYLHQPNFTRPPPGFAAPEHSVSFFPGHSHHPSEAAGPWPYPPYSMPQADAILENGAASSLPVGPTEYPSHYDGDHMTKVDINGTAMMHDDSPSKANFGEAKSDTDRADEQRIAPYQNGFASQVTRYEEPAFELAAYLCTQFGNPEFADFMLQIRSPDAVLVSLPVHGIIVTRSPVIADAVRRSIPASHRARDARRMLDVICSDPFATRESLEEAVKVLYGAPLLSPQVFLYGLSPYLRDSTRRSSDARMRMRQLLSYIAAGRTLQVPSMQARGVDIARSLIRWDTVEEVLQVALRSSSSFWPKKDGVETEDPFTSALLNCALDFMAYTFPVGFNLYTIAPELEGLPRLPSLLEARSANHNPRLSKIRFGDAPPEDDDQPDHAARVLSSVLLSLPLPLLDRMFNHRATANQVGWSGVVRIMRDVTAERESRRKKALRSEIRAAQDGTIPGSLLSNMYFEEHLEQVEESPLHPSGYRLVAQRLPSHV